MRSENWKNKKIVKRRSDMVVSEQVNGMCRKGW